MNRQNEILETKYTTDVLVVGGGVAGVCASVAAAQMGMEVILIERNGKCGGNFTSSLVSTIDGYHTSCNGELTQICRGLSGKVLERLNEENSVGEYITYAKVPIIPFDIPVLMKIFDDMIQESKVRVLYHQHAYHVEMDGDRIEKIAVSSKTGRYYIKGKVVLDCTGDGDIAWRAGVPQLNEGESVQYPSLMFHLGGVDFAEARKIKKKELNEYLRKAFDSGNYDFPRIDGSISLLPRDGVVQANLGRLKIDDHPIDPLNDEELSFGQTEGRRQAFLYLDFLRKYVPGYENAYIAVFPETVGIRETRRMRGRYVLTKEDFFAARKFKDGVVCSSWPMELHKSGNATEWVHFPEGEYMEVPLRCFIPEKIGNLLFAGRCLSADQSAHASVRCGAPCMCMGEAVGVCAALAIRYDKNVGDVDGNEVKNVLKSRGAYLTEPVKNEEVV